MVKTVIREFETQGFGEIHDLTGWVREIVETTGLSQGVVTIFAPGATAGVTTVEFEDGLVHDLTEFFERIIPQGMAYLHNERWKDGNGFSHVRASLLGPSLQVPVFEGRPTLGTWQQVILIDFDNRPRNRRVVLQVMGEE